MGKRICKSWNAPGEPFLTGLLLALFFVIGGLLGCLFFYVCDDVGKRDLAAYLSDYLRIAGDGTLSQKFGAAAWSELRYGLCALLLWWTAFRAAGYMLLFVVRGFLLTFSVGAFVCVFGAGGLLPSCVLFFLPALCWAPALFLLAVCGLRRTRCSPVRTDGVRAGVNSGELRCLALAAVLYLMGSILESVLLPRLLPLVAGIVL